LRYILILIVGMLYLFAQTECDNLAGSTLDHNIIGVEYKNIKPLRALEICKKEYEQNPNRARTIYELGRVYDKLAEYESANRLFLKSCNLGYPIACYNLGINYRHGDGVIRDLNKTLFYFKKACFENISEPCNSIGYIYENMKRYLVASKYYAKSCNLGNGMSCSNLGKLYYSRKIAGSSDAKAMALFKLGCKLGNRESCRYVKIARGFIGINELQKELIYLSNSINGELNKYKNPKIEDNIDIKLYSMKKLVYKILLKRKNGIYFLSYNGGEIYYLDNNRTIVLISRDKDINYNDATIYNNRLIYIKNNTLYNIDSKTGRGYKLNINKNSENIHVTSNNLGDIFIGYKISGKKQNLYNHNFKLKRGVIYNDYIIINKFTQNGKLFFSKRIYIKDCVLLNIVKFDKDNNGGVVFIGEGASALGATKGFIYNIGSSGNIKWKHIIGNFYYNNQFDFKIYNGYLYVVGLHSYKRNYENLYTVIEKVNLTTGRMKIKKIYKSNTINHILIDKNGYIYLVGKISKTKTTTSGKKYDIDKLIVLKYNQNLNKIAQFTKVFKNYSISINDAYIDNKNIIHLFGEYYSLIDTKTKPIEMVVRLKN